jgi:large subunit ribosomal protein L17
MRHGKKVNHLSRQSGHRKAMLANMACSLIEHKRINTTVAKAKALKQFVEPLITKSKEDTTHNRRIVFAYLRNKYAVTDLFRDVAAKVGDRPGGYTRIIKMGNRLGDNADMAMIELVDFNELYNGGKKEEKKGRSRRGGKGKGATAMTDASSNAAAQSKETPKAPVEEANAEAPQAETQVAEEPIVDAAPAAPEAEAPAAEVATEEAPVAEVPAAEASEAPEAEGSSDEEKKEE